MAIPTSRSDRERGKFVDDGSGNTAIRYVITTATLGTGSGLGGSLGNREMAKFVQDDSGNTAVILNII